MIGVSVGLAVMGLRVGALDGGSTGDGEGRSVGGTSSMYVGIAVGEKVGRSVILDEANSRVP